MLSAAEIGDYDRAVHHYGYVSEFKLLPALVSALCDLSCHHGNAG